MYLPYVKTDMGYVKLDADTYTDPSPPGEE